MKFLTILLIIGLLSLGACSEKLVPAFDNKPNISIKSITPTTITQFKDSVVIVIDYEDGDGDLGFEQADSLAATVRDQRVSNSDKYYVPPLAPIGQNISIKGTLTFTIKSIFLLGNGNSETTRFEVQLHDRAGHYSNIATSQNITINK